MMSKKADADIIYTLGFGLGFGIVFASIFVKDPQGYVVLLIGLIIMGIGSWISGRIKKKAQKISESRES
jgi:xanthosine utilization system XapX-like protein